MLPGNSRKFTTGHSFIVAEFKGLYKKEIKEYYGGMAKKKKIIKKAKPKKKIVKKPVKRKIKKISYREAVKKLKPKPKRKKPVKRKPVRKVKSRKKTVKPRVFIGKDPLDQLFESQAKVKLLKFFFRNAEDIFEAKDIFKRLRSNVALLKQEMKKLEKLGLIKQKKAWLSFEQKRGGIKKVNKTVFYLNPGFNFNNELRNLVLKTTVSSRDELISKAKKIGNIKLFVVSGVFTENPSASADLLIVGDKISSKKLNVFLKDLEAEVGKELNCAVMGTKEFDYRYDMYDRFVRDLIETNSEILIKKVNLW